MPGNKEIVLIITTRNYPLAIWENAGLLCFTSRKLVFNGKARYGLDNPIYFKKLRFNQFLVYVAPCLLSNVNDEDRRHYLESLVSTIDDDYNGVFLIAHDGDFNKKNRGAIVSSSDIPQGDYPIPKLSALVQSGHVYMYQHDAPQISDAISRINVFVNETLQFGVQHCVDLLELIDHELAMISFFQVVDTNPKNRYPEMQNRE